MLCNWSPWHQIFVALLFRAPSFFLFFVLLWGGDLSPLPLPHTHNLSIIVASFSIFCGMHLFEFRNSSCTVTVVVHTARHVSVVCIWIFSLFITVHTAKQLNPYMHMAQLHPVATCWRQIFSKIETGTVQSSYQARVQLITVPDTVDTGAANVEHSLPPSGPN